VTVNPYREALIDTALAVVGALLCMAFGAVVSLLIQGAVS
jgi:hypothetical protein